MDDGGIGHWLVRLPLPQEPIHFVSMPCVCLEWRGDWNGVTTEAPPQYTAPVLSLSFLWMIHPDCRVQGRRMNDREDYTFESRFLIRLLHRGKWEGPFGVLLLSIHWGENWSMQVSDVGFNVWWERGRKRAREREVHLYSSSTDGRCWSDVLSPSAGQPCLILSLHVSRYSWHDQL